MSFGKGEFIIVMFRVVGGLTTDQTRILSTCTSPLSPIRETTSGLGPGRHNSPIGWRDVIANFPLSPRLFFDHVEKSRQRSPTPPVVGSRAIGKRRPDADQRRFFDEFAACM